MKKLSSIIIAAGAILAVSCSKEANFSDPVAEENLIDITVIASEKPAAESEDTKTYIDGTSVKWSDSGEKLKVFEVATPTEGDVVTTQATSVDGVTSDSGATMSFGVTLAGKSEGYSSFDYYAVYPSSAYQTGSAVTGIALNTKGAQTPTATNFDATADLLIAKKIENGATQASTLEMQFARVVAIGKMTIKNLESTDPITKITFSAKVGEEAVALAGRTNFNLETAKPVSAYASNTQEHSIILDYEGQNITANTAAGMVAYFTCYPFAINAETPGSFKVVVETATQSFTKEVSVSSAKGLAFNIGKASVFSVNMDGITGETKEVDLRFAYLDYEDFTDNGGTTSYGNVTANKTHGDSWVMYAIGTNNSIGVRRNDDGTNDSYIKLPDFKEDIKTVIVTLKNVTAAKTITLESSASASNGSIASLTTTEASVYTFDLSSTSVKTAYFRSSGFQAQVEKIEVYAGDDNRSKFGAPASVSAELNNDDPDITNSIDVSWTLVDGAAGYVITLTPDTGDDVIVKASSSPYTVTDLAFEMDYLVSVQAEPADYYENKISDMTTFADVVTTGAAAAGVVALTENEITAGDNTVKGTNNAHLAYRLGTSSNNGSLTFDAGYESITFTLAGWASGTRSFTITNGTIGGSTSLSPSAGTPSGTINASFNTSFSGTEYTIIVDDPSEEVVFSGRRAVVWGFTAVEATPDTRTDVTLAFAEDAFELTVDSSEYDSFKPQAATATPSVSPITYAITGDTGIASGFNTSTGAFTLTGTLGTATITASYAGDSSYKPTEASYTVTVKAASINTSTESNPYSVSDVLSLIGSLDSSTEVENVYVKGIVSEIVEAYNSKYGNVTFNISADGTTAGDQFEAYRAAASSADDFQVGDAVLMVGTAKNYNGDTPEYKAGATAVTVIHKPTFTPNGGSFTEDAKSVTISAAAGTTIYYTIDGTDPTTSSSVYSSALSLTSTTTVKAIAVKDDLTTGIASATFTKSVGSSVHVATINFNSGTGTAINDASVTGDDSEGNEWTITTEGTTSFTANAAYYQVGSSKKPASSITFTTTLASSATDIELEAKFGGFSGTTGDVTLKVGDTSIGTGSLNAANDVTVSSTSTGSGTVLTVTITNIAKGVKVYYIKATYTN